MTLDGSSLVRSCCLSWIWELCELFFSIESAKKFWSINRGLLID